MKMDYAMVDDIPSGLYCTPESCVSLLLLLPPLLQVMYLTRRREAVRAPCIFLGVQ
jgi:hypothetical protein